MVLVTPWFDSYLHNQIYELSSVIFYINYFHIPLCPSTCDDKANVNNNELEELGMTNLNPINLLMTTSET